MLKCSEKCLGRMVRKTLRVEKVVKNNEDFKAVKNIFLKAFPACERPPHAFLYLRSKITGNEYLGVYDGDALVGMSYVISSEKVAYIFFLAIAEEHRGKGYGTDTLDALKALYGDKKIILAIEEMDERADNYPERLRRLKFYEKNGFRMSGYKLREVNMVYDLLSLTEPPTPEEYSAIPRVFLGKFLSKIFKMEIFK